MYLCKNCKSNNNGWCELHRKQGLKAIEKCDEYENKTTVSPPKDLRGSVAHREMLLAMQEHAIKVINGDSEDKVGEIMNGLTAMDMMLTMAEDEKGILNSCALDQDGKNKIRKSRDLAKEIA